MTVVLRSALSHEPISLIEHERLVAHQAAGAVVGFAGVVRDHDGGRGVVRLEYSAHPSAEQTLAEVLAEPEAILLVVTSTHGAGDVPDNLQPFAKDQFRGAAMTPLAKGNSLVVYDNLGAAVGRMRDVDVASESAALARNQVLAQAGIAVLAQANQTPQVALSLLRQG